MEETENKEPINAEKELLEDFRKELMDSYERDGKEIINKIFAIADKTIGIEIDPNAYKRYNEDN